MGDVPSGFQRGPEPAGGFPSVPAGGAHPSGMPLPAPSVPAGAAPFITSGLPGVGAPSAGGRFQMLEEHEADPELAHLTNIYYLSQYTYQLSISAIAMAEHELGLLLPRSGRVWFNAKLFTDMPHGRELATRDAWWRAVDSSPAVRFLLGWCVSIYRTAQFHQIPRDQLPGWSRILYFSPALAEATRLRIQFWSDVAQDVTTLFAPSARLWRQIQAFTPMHPGDRRWQAKLAVAGHRVAEVVQFLADRNGCPQVIVSRALNGNLPMGSFDEYHQFTEELLDDIPRLAMQRRIAMQQSLGSGAPPPPDVPPLARIGAMLRGRWPTVMPDPRQQPDFWQLYL